MRQLTSSSAFGIPSASRDRVVSGKTNRSHGKTLTKGGKGQIGGLDDNDDSTTDPSSSEDDDTPNADLGFAMNTRVFMADGTTKRIKNIQPGEYVLGPDRMPRLVISTSIGCSPMIQSLCLATAQVQGVHVRHDAKWGNHTASFHQLKCVHDSMVVVHSTKTFQDTKPNAKQEADAFVHNQSKDVIYWSLPKDHHHLVSKAIQLQTYHLTTAIDFETERLQYHALKSGFTDVSGMQEKLAYIWGTWTGDGNSIHTSIAVNLKDREQIARIEDVCSDLGLAASLYKQSERKMARGCMGGEVSITSRAHKRRNYLMTFLRRLGLGKSGSNGGATPHDHDKASQRRIYHDVTIATIYPKIAEGVFVLARSLGISYSACHMPAKSRGQYTQKPICHIGLLPCHALTNVLSLCAVDTKWQRAPVNFTRHHIEYRYGAFHQGVVDAIHRLSDLPSVLPQNPDEETRALIHQLDYSTLTLLAKRYQNFGYSRDQIHERLSVPINAISAYLANKGDNEKLDNFMRDQVFEKLPIEVIRRLVLLAHNPHSHHAIALTLDPASDGLFVLGNNAVVTSKQGY
ncbi:H(+)-transporting V1 sector ATPase subunit A [Podila minutissima]|uniref:H(+)-transporting V1 sector ATPase subunit A n=1 Tax=Podila minutissima TaxID=64525 RepID=A0A9P5SEG2_9FUNG|nr:H(+)-transporting V1 sector ATPase subunit A [Podila minutissima]